MLKKALVCFLLPVVLYASEVVKQFAFETPKVIDGIVYLNGCHPTEDGFAPMLAEKPVALLLPSGYTALSFNVEFSEPVELNGEFFIKPYRPSVSVNSNVNQDFMTKLSAVYSENNFYPAPKRSNWFDVQYKNGHPIFITAVRPVQYNPVTGKLRYSKSVKISVNTGIARSDAPYVCTPLIKSQLRSIVDNPEEVNKLPLTTKEADDYEMLIITSDALKGSWTAYVDFNKRRCLRTKIETLQNIKATMTGVDDQEKMRNYIKKEYTDNKIVYVLLGGDATTGQAYNIPVRFFRSQMYDHNVSAEKWHDENDLPADGLYFGCLDGTWKGSNTDYGMPGDRDMFAEVYVARFPVDNATQLTNMINKSIKYSETPVRDQVKRNMLSGNYLWENGGVTCWGIDNSELYMDLCTQNGYTTYGFPKNDWNTARISDKATSGWSITTWRALVKSHKPTWIDHNGHGAYTQAFNETNSGVTTANYPQDGASANFFIITTGICCYPGGFDKSECLLEAFVNLSTGCVAAITNARTGWGDDDGTDGCSPRLFRYFHDALFNPKYRYHFLGMMLACSKEANADIIINFDYNKAPYFGGLTYCAYEMNVLGDPALSIWTDTPKDFATLPEYTATPAEFTMKTPPLTWVALCDASGAILTTQLTGLTSTADSTIVNIADSTCKINDEPYKQYVAANPGGKLKVKIKAHNYIAAEKEITLSTAVTNDKLYTVLGIHRIYSYGKTVFVQYTLRKKELVTISLFDVKGALIKTLFRNTVDSGINRNIFNLPDIGNGVYYCKVKAGAEQRVEKLVISR